MKLKSEWLGILIGLVIVLIVLALAGCGEPEPYVDPCDAACKARLDAEHAVWVEERWPKGCHTLDGEIEDPSVTLLWCDDGVYEVPSWRTLMGQRRLSEKWN